MIDTEHFVNRDWVWKVDENGRAALVLFARARDHRGLPPRWTWLLKTAMRSRAATLHEVSKTRQGC